LFLADGLEFSKFKMMFKFSVRQRNGLSGTN